MKVWEEWVERKMKEKGGQEYDTEKGIRTVGESKIKEEEHGKRKR